MNRDDDMNHVKSADRLRQELDAGKVPDGVYGDSIGGMTFRPSEAKLLERLSPAGWREVFAGPGCTVWTIIEVPPEAQ